MTFEQLYYFCEVYHQKSVSLSSYNLNISRQSLSASIKRLEEELNTSLFIRSINGVSPTPAGKQFYKYAQNALLEATKIKQELLKLNEPTYNPTIHKIAVCDYIMATYGKIFYTLLSKKFPEQRFLLNTLAIKELSLQKENDIMFTIINSQNLKLSTLKNEFGDDWEVKFLRSYDIHVWLNSSSPFANEKVISFDSLKDINFCTLKSHINETKTTLDSFLGYYKMNVAPISIQLEEIFVDYVEKFNYMTIDIPFKNNEFAYTEIFKDKNCVVRPTDASVSLIAIYKKDINQYLYQYFYNLLLHIQ